MTTITIDRALLEQALEALSCGGGDDDPGHRCSHCDDYVDRNGGLRAVLCAELAKPVEGAKPVAWMDDFGNAFPIGAVKGAGSWRDSHQRNWKPLYLHPPTPAWHDEPTVPGLWYSTKSKMVWNFQTDAAIRNSGGYSGRWLGPIPQEKEGEKS